MTADEFKQKWEVCGVFTLDRQSVHHIIANALYEGANEETKKVLEQCVGCEFEIEWNLVDEQEFARLIFAKRKEFVVGS